MYNQFQNQMRFAVRTGLCPVCGKRERARWKDTRALRVTCGHPACFAKWLPGPKTAAAEPLNALPTPSEEMAA